MGQHRRGRRPRLRPRRAHHRPGRRRARARPTPRRRRCCPAGSGCSSSPPRRSCPAGRSRSSTPARSTASSGSSACTATRRLDVGAVGLREGPITGAADRLEVTLTGPGGHTSRPHLTEDLTYALAKVVTELPADPVPPGRPPRRRERGLGHRARRLGPQRHPRDRPDRRHACGCSTPRLGRGREAGAALVEADRRAVRRARGGRLPARRAAGGQRRAVDRPARARPWSGCSARPGTCRPSRASAARTSRGTSTGSPAPWAGSAPARPGGPTYDLHQGNLRVDERALGFGAKVLAGAVDVGGVTPDCARRIDSVTLRRALAFRTGRGPSGCTLFSRPDRAFAQHP